MILLQNPGALIKVCPTDGNGPLGYLMHPWENCRTRTVWDINPGTATVAQ